MGPGLPAPAHARPAKAAPAIAACIATRRSVRSARAGELQGPCRPGRPGISGVLGGGPREIVGGCVSAFTRIDRRQTPPRPEEPASAPRRRSASPGIARASSSYDRIVLVRWNWHAECHVTGMSRRHASPWRPTRASGRWRFLADASVALDTSIEYEQTLSNTVRLAVPEVADYCVVILLNEDGSTRWANSAHRNPAKRALLESLRGFVPPPFPEHPLWKALRTGKPQLISDAGAQIVKWW